MLVHVVDLDPSASSHYSPVDADTSFGSIKNALWVPVPGLVAVSQLDNILVDLAPVRALRSEVTVLGLHPDLASKLPDDSPVFDDVFRRVEEAPLYVVRHAGVRPELHHVRGETLPDIESRQGELLRTIREADVGSVVRRTGAELPKHSTLHYEGPNGSHYGAYLRVGLALRSTAELDRVSFWLAEHFEGRTCLLADQWTLVGLGYHLGVYMERLGLKKRVVRIEAVGSYDETPELLALRLELGFAEAGTTELGLLLSVHSSGDLASRMLEAAARAGFEQPAVAAVCSTPRSPASAPALCTLGAEFDRVPLDECATCAEEGGTLVPVRHDTYLLELAAFVRQESIKREDGAAGKDFVSRYTGSGVVSIHRYDADDRHHCFYLDVDKIVDHPEFRARLDDEVAGWRTESLEGVICPPHSAARHLAAVVAEKLGGLPVVACSEKDLHKLGGEERRLLLEASRLCVVDDVVITGSRLYGYRNHLIRLRRRNGRAGEFDLFCFVGVARPTDDWALRGIRDVTYTDRGPRFKAVEKLLLPHWTTRHECPWCDEYERLNALPADIRTKPRIIDRLKRLASTDGLTEDLFLPWTTVGALGSGAGVTEDEWEARSRDDQGEPGEFTGEYWQLNAGSVFGDVKGAELMLSVAAAIQGLRNSEWSADRGWVEPRLDEIFRSPIAKVLHPGLYMTGRFYEPVLVASILRAVHRHDVRAPINEQRLVDAVEYHLARSGTSDELRAELLFAAARGVLPMVDVDLDDTDPTPGPDVRAALKSMLSSTSHRPPRAATHAE